VGVKVRVWVVLVYEVMRKRGPGHPRPPPPPYASAILGTVLVVGSRVVVFCTTAGTNDVKSVNS